MARTQGWIVGICLLASAHTFAAYSVLDEQNVTEVIGLFHLVVSELADDDRRVTMAPALQLLVSGAYEEAQAQTIAIAATVPESDEMSTIRFEVLLAISSWLADTEAEPYERHLDRALSLCQLDAKVRCPVVLRTAATLYFANGQLRVAESSIRSLIDATDDEFSETLVDDLDLLARILLMQGELRRADHTMERLVDLGKAQKKSDPLFAFRIFEHWLQYRAARVGRSSQVALTSRMDMFSGDTSISSQTLPTLTSMAADETSYPEVVRTGNTRPGPMLEDYLELGLAQFSDPLDQIMIIVSYVKLSIDLDHSSRHIRDGVDELVARLDQVDLEAGEAARLYLFAADGYNIRRYYKDASKNYEHAYRLAGSVESEQAFLDSFSTPRLLYPAGLFYPVVLRSAPDNYNGGPLFAEYTYDVDGRGRVRDVDLAESNVPIYVQRAQIQRLKRAIYRPRIVNGKVAEATGNQQRFEFLIWQDLEHINR